MKYKCLGLDTGNNISKLSFNNIDGMATYENEYQDGMMLWCYDIMMLWYWYHIIYK